MNIKGIGLDLCKKYLLPVVKRIGTSLISNLGKSMYEKLYSRFTKATNSFEDVLLKLKDTSDLKKFKRRVECSRLGLNFFIKIQEVLEEVLADYSAAVEDAEEKLFRMTGDNIEN